MANPYGITQVDIPGMLGMHQQMKRQRLEDLYTAKKIELEDRKLQQEERRAGVMAKLFTGGTKADPSVDMTPTEEEAPAWAREQAPQPVAPPVRQDGLKINPAALQELATIDLELAMKFSEFAGKADKAQLEQVQRHGEQKALAAKHLLQFPEGPARQAELQRIAPDLLARGFTEQDLASADLSTKTLNKDVTFGMSLKDLVSIERAEQDDAESRRRWEIQEARAARAEGRQQRRFEERDLDRQALSGRYSGQGVGGRTFDDTSDLDY